mgnify:CR=1 FL=1|tara:strand:+ start:103 stop:495 length:393 start_codon:yes stop_codon:yes gene_type:complete
MAHFAKLDSNNIVTEVVVVHNDVATSESAGVAFLNSMYKTNDTWKQTSYNTISGEHKLGGTPFRKNYAAKGYTYDSTKDAFIPPKPYDSWTLDEDTCQWEAPVEKPGGDNIYEWNEDTKSWDLVHQAGIG